MVQGFDGTNTQPGQVVFALSISGNLSVSEISNVQPIFGTDGATELTTPYDHCFLVMPNRKPAKGGRLVRLAREV